MAEARLIQKQLAGVEDLLLGVGTATQTRATGPKTITKINADRLQGALVVDTIDELLALNPTLLVKGTCIVKDENRGGVFVYQEANALINNGGTIFNGWTRQDTILIDTVTGIKYKLVVANGILSIVEIA